MTQNFVCGRDLNILDVHRDTAFDGVVVDVFQKLVKGVSLGRAAENSGNLSPVSPLFSLMDNDLKFRGLPPGFCFAEPGERYLTPAWLLSGRSELKHFRLYSLHNCIAYERTRI